MSESAAIVVFCTVPDPESAERLARGLVGERLAACVNILPAVRSIYVWQGQLQDDAELLLVIKSVQPRFERLRDWLVEQHPYDVPEVVAVPVSNGSPAYLTWLEQQTHPPEGE